MGSRQLKSLHPVILVIAIIKIVSVKSLNLFSWIFKCQFLMEFKQLGLYLSCNLNSIKIMKLSLMFGLWQLLQIRARNMKSNALM